MIDHERFFQNLYAETYSPDAIENQIEIYKERTKHLMFSSSSSSTHQTTIPGYINLTYGSYLDHDIIRNHYSKFTYEKPKMIYTPMSYYKFIWGHVAQKYTLVVEHFLNIFKQYKVFPFVGAIELMVCFYWSLHTFSIVKCSYNRANIHLDEQTNLQFSQIKAALQQTLQQLIKDKGECEANEDEDEDTPSIRDLDILVRHLREESPVYFIKIIFIILDYYFKYLSNDIIVQCFDLFCRNNIFYYKSPHTISLILNNINNKCLLIE